MPSNRMLTKYAKLAVKVGVNIKKNQRVVLRTTTEAKELTRLIAEQCYLAGAKQVHIIWADEYITKSTYTHASIDTLTQIPQWNVDQYQYYVDEKAAFISIASPLPGLMDGVDPKKQQAALLASQSKLGFFREHTMGNTTQWTIVAAANPTWAKKIFPDLNEKKACEALWNAIFNATRVFKSNNPIKDWKDHNQNLLARNQLLNNLNFKTLHFTNSLGTDLTVELIKDHIWAGGGEIARNKVYFNPNIPTEETFTMPYKFGTQGKVYSTKPLAYQGSLIDQFYLEFKDGKVINFDAKQGKEALANILNFDDNARYIGEIALISYDSPISNTNILFYNTLFDENASCHMALGRAYPMNIKDGHHKSIKELEELGYNNSMVHVDFMFGSSDLKIVGKTHDGKEVLVFENGNFVI